MKGSCEQPQSVSPGPQCGGPIAVIGLSCRFPGEASDAGCLWEMLEKGHGAWSEIPKTRMNVEGYYHPDPSRQGSLSLRGGHFLEKDVAAFDASFFSIAPNEAVAMDPQQRMLLETTYEALESAGIPMEAIDGTDTTVYIGSFVKDYEQVCMRDQDNAPLYAATGNGIAILANRISHYFNLAGTSQTIDTGCSASLVAVHQACLSLLSGECSAAIAGGVGLILTPNTTMPMTSLGFLSPDGKCYAFDSRANGYGRGEGAGIVILKRLEDAIAGNDTIRGVIRATGSNQDGRTPGITLPSMERQVANIRQTYLKAGLDPNRTEFVECHGTGTRAGDVREMEAVHRAITHARDADKPVIVGSIKTNVGHLEGAAGVAGLIKAILTTEKGYIPKHLNFQTPNPDIKFSDWKVKVPTELTAWPTPGLRRASVNCFGFGGTNAHAIVDDAAHYLAEVGIGGYHGSHIFEGGDSMQRLAQPTNKEHRSATGPRLFVYSSHQHDRVALVARSHAPYIFRNKDKQPATTEDLMMRYSYTLLERRSKMEWKAFIIANGPDDLVQKLMNPTNGMSQVVRSPRNQTRPRVALIFAGQGGQRPAMGSELLRYSLVWESLRAADTYMRNKLGSEFNLLQEMLVTDAALSRIHESLISQPATTALQVALVDLLRAGGVEPVATLGHSSGEIAAAYAASAISREVAWELAYHRGRTVHQWQLQQQQEQSEGGKGRRGRMLVVGLSDADVRPFVDTLVPIGSVQVACVNGPTLVTLAGDEDAIMEIDRALAKTEIFHRQVHVDVAYHSSHMTAVGPVYYDAIQGVQPQQLSGDTTRAGLTAALYSSLTGKKVTPSVLGAKHWVDNLTKPVLFYQAMREMMKDAKPDVLVEVAPQCRWEGTVRRILEDIGHREPVTFLPTLNQREDEATSVLKCLGGLWARGCRVKMDFTFATGATVATNGEQTWQQQQQQQRPPQHLYDLPPYPWSHERRYWCESGLSKMNRFRSHGREDLIGAPFDLALSSERSWRGFFRLSENPWMEDHQIQKLVMYPAAGMIAMAIEAGKQLAELAVADNNNTEVDSSLEVLGFEVSSFVILKPIIVPVSGEGLEHCISVKTTELGSLPTSAAPKSTTYAFTIYTRLEGMSNTKHAYGQLRIAYAEGGGSFCAVDEQDESASDAERYRQSYRNVKSCCRQTINPRQLYERLDNIGLSYGPMFRNMVALTRDVNDGHGSRCCLSEVCIPNTQSRMPFNFEYPHVIHPATLDAVMQTVLAIGEESMLPTSIESIFVSAKMPQGSGKKLAGYSKAEAGGRRQAFADIVMFDNQKRGGATGEPVVIIKGLEFRSVAPTTVGTEGGGLGLGLGFLPNHRNLCSEVVWREDVDSSASSRLAEWIDLLGHKEPALSILYIGGSVDMAIEMLGILGEAQRYDTPRFSYMAMCGPDDNAYKALQLSDVRQIVKERVEWEADEGFALNSGGYDLVVIGSAGMRDLSALSEAVRPGGHIVLCSEDGTCDEVTSLCDAAAGGTGADGVSPSGTAILEPPELNGFCEMMVLTGGSADQSYLVGRKPHAQHGRPIKKPQAKASTTDVVIIIPGDDQLSQSLQSLLDSLCVSLSNMANVTVKETLTFSADLIWTNNKTVYISLVEAEKSVLFDIAEVDEALFEAVHALFRARNMIWLTGGGCQQTSAASPTRDPRCAGTVGLARTVRSEDGRKKLVNVDVDLEDEEGYVIAQGLVGIFRDVFITNGRAAPTGEFEYVLRNGKRFIPRLVTLTAVNNLIERASNGRPQAVDQFPLWQQLQQGEEHGRVAAVKLDAGSLSGPDGPYFIPEAEPQELGPNEVRIRVKRCNLLPDDMHTILGQGLNEIGSDAQGTVIEVGAQVLHLRVGEYVSTFCRGAIRTTVVVDERFAWRQDQPLASGGGSGLLYSPAALLTAAYGLLIVGRLSAGDCVLIHAAASVYGQHAMSIARVVGVRKVIAGVSNGAQREAVRRMMLVPDGHIVDTSDASSLIAAVKRLTDGKGVDTVFNPTSENVEANFECVAEYGNITQLSSPKLVSTSSTWQQSIVYKNLHFEVFDIWSLAAKRPQLISRVMGEVYAIFYSPGAVGATERAALVDDLMSRQTLHSHGLQDIEAALTKFKQDPYIGQHVLTVDEDTMVRMPVSITRSLELSTDATYLLIGGFGGLGRSIANLLVDRGARNLAIVSRSGAQSEAALDFLRQLREERGVVVRELRVDICDYAGLEAGLASLTVTAPAPTSSSGGQDEGLIWPPMPPMPPMPPIRGAVQCAAVLEDCAFDRMTHARFRKAFGPKVAGSWNLHKLLPADMDFFVLLSSAAGIVGNRGQANYSAGNTFQDALAHHRTASLGRRTVSLDLGLVLEAGMVAEDERLLDVMRASGFFGVRLEDVHFLVERAMVGDLQLPTQVVTAVGTGGLAAQNRPADPFWSRSRLFAYLNRVDLAPGGGAGGSALEPSPSSMRGSGGGTSPFPSRPSTSSSSGTNPGGDLRMAIRNAPGRHEAASIVCSSLVRALAKLMGVGGGGGGGSASSSFTTDGGSSSGGSGHIPVTAARDLIDPTKSTVSYGLDSLVKLSFTRWIVDRTGVAVADVDEFGSIRLLAERIAELVLGGVEGDE